MLALWLGLCYLLARPASGETAASNAVCGPDSCYTAHLRRRTFNEAWRECRDRGGNLASVKRQAEEELVEELLRGLALPEADVPLKFWLGLQRQPRQCSARKPLRGFTWTTGDQDTRFTNWLSEEAAGSCPAARCVVVAYGTSHTNFKWVDGSCQLAVDGYLCRYTFRGMCPRIEMAPSRNEMAPSRNEMAPSRTVSYATPFGLTISSLRFAPFGSVASLDCGAARGPVSLLCKARGSGVGWSRDVPYCEERREAAGWCGAGNGGCQHLCVDDGAYYHCECQPGYEVSRDGRTCLDVDECAFGPCPHQCTNSPGSFACRCAPGFEEQEGECLDVDECDALPCQQLCANSEGSYQCYCEVGFTLDRAGGSSCSDVDECQFQGSCQQMCINYLGHFECHCEEGYLLDLDGFTCHPSPSTSSPHHPAWPPLPSLLPLDPRGLPPDPEGEEGWGTGSSLTVPASRGVGGAGATPAGEETGIGEGSEPLPAHTGGPLHTEPLPAHTGGPGQTQPLPAHTAVARQMEPLPAQPTGGPRQTKPLFAQPSGGPQHTELLLAQPTGGPRQTEPLPAQPTGGPRHTEPLPAHTGVPRQMEPLPAQPTGGPRHTEPLPAHTGGPLQTQPLPAHAGGPRQTQPLPAHNSSWPVGPPTLARDTNAEGSRPMIISSGGSGQPQGSEDARDHRWLLVALLVPVCIFGVVMLALGIAYCTRCACGRSRTITDCYRWINGSSKASGPGTGTSAV